MADKSTTPAKADDKAQHEVWKNIDVQVEYRGKHVVLPDTPVKMTPRAGIKVLERIEEAENQKYDVQEFVEGAPWDAIVALTKALRNIYGVVLAESVRTPFGEIRPDLVTVKIGPEPEDCIQVPTGQMMLPNITSPVQVGFNGQGAYIAGTVVLREKQTLVEIVTLARQMMARDSIYKGRAIKLGVDEEGNLELFHQPEFIQLKDVTESDMIHTKDTFDAIDNNIFGPLKYTDACRRLRIPLKRGILLEGRYGTGKTLTARVTAKVSVDNAWTFIMLDKAQGLAEAINFARNYQPCVIFAEDIDRASEDRENDEEVNHLINLLDGLITKDMEMMVVLTTNFIDRIDPALLRPGRFDAVISIEAPDSDTVIRVVRHYGRDLIADDVNLSEVGDILAGQIPATIREVVERAKVLMLMQSRDHLTTRDLVSTAKGMAKHIALLEVRKEEKTPAQRLHEAFVELIQSAAGIDTDDMDEKLGNLILTQRRMATAVTKKLEETAVFAKAAAGSADSAHTQASAARQVATDDYHTTREVLKKVS